MPLCRDFESKNHLKKIFFSKFFFARSRYFIRYPEIKIKNSVQPKLPEQAEVTEIKRLKSKNADRLERTHSGTFKVVIKYNGPVLDLYDAQTYPKNSEVKRYRFLRERRSIHNSVLDG